VLEGRDEPARALEGRDELEPQLGEAAAGSELAKLRSGDTTAAAAESSGVGEELRSFSGAFQELPRSP